MKWSRVLAQLAKLAALLLLVPGVLVVSLRWDSVLPIIIYLQLLLIWVQAEISLRQNALFAAQFEPLFDVRVAGSSPMTLTIENVSESPSYALAVARLFDRSGNPMDPKQWTGKID